MRNAIRITGILLVLLLLTGSAYAKRWQSYSLIGTKWAGNITVVDTAGATITIPTLLIFVTEKDGFVSGTISAPAVAFSGIKDDYSRSIKMTAPNIKMHAEVRRGGHGHGWRDDWGVHTAATLEIEGSNLLDGSMFEGVLAQQQ